MGTLDVCQVVKVLAHHLRHQHDPRKILCLIFAYQLSVSENRNAVAHRIDLLQEMGYKYNPHSLSPELSHQDEQLFHLIIVQRGSRLVKNQHPALHIHGAGNSNHLLLCQRTLLQLIRGIGIYIKTLQKF